MAWTMARGSLEGNVRIVLDIDVFYSGDRVRSSHRRRTANTNQPTACSYVSPMVLELTGEKTGPCSIDSLNARSIFYRCMKSPVACVLTLCALPITFLYAGVVPINPTQLGVQPVSNLALNGHGVCNVPGVGGCGGGFTATVAGTPNVTLWCVDSQEFDTNNLYTANIVSLNTTAGPFDNGTQVRYGSVGLAPTSTGRVGPILGGRRF